jgi:hypothetical protein
MIYFGDIVRSPLLTPPLIMNQAFEEVEHHFHDVANDTRIMVRKCIREGIIFHYTTTRMESGFVRRIVMFHSSEEDPLPVTIDEEEYETL